MRPIIARRFRWRQGEKKSRWRQAYSSHNDERQLAINEENTAFHQNHFSAYKPTLLPAVSRANRYSERPRHQLFRDDIQVTAAAARVHRARIPGLIVFQQRGQIDGKRGVPQHAGQKRLPTAHALVHRGGQPLEIASDDRIVAVLARLAQAADPLRIEVLDAQRIVAFGPRGDGNHGHDTFQPAGDDGIVAAFDMHWEDASLVRGVEVQAADTRID